MKKSTVNYLTTLLGTFLIAAIIPVVFLATENLGIIIPSLFVCGVSLVYFKNNDFQGLLKVYLKRFIK